MSSHRLALVILIAAALGPAAASAQSAPAPAASPAAGYHHRKHHHESFNRALRQLTLTPAQQQQIEGFRAAEKTANLNADPATKEANAHKMHAQIMGVLTPDQQTQMQAAMHPNGMKTGAVPVPSPSPM